MSRIESDREDIMREAVGLVDRVEYRIPGFSETVVVGFRRNGAVSFFFGQDEVFQFNDLAKLRRCYLNGALIKAEQGRLILMRRERTATTEVQLWSSELNETQTNQLLSDAWNRIGQLREATTIGFSEICQHVSRIPDADVTSRVIAWIDRLPNPLAIADAPNVAGR